MDKSTKPRSAAALAAWNRHGGAHTGAKKPSTDDATAIAEGLDEALEEAEDDFLSLFFGGTIIIDGEELEIEWDFSEDEEDDDE